MSEILYYSNLLFFLKYINIQFIYSEIQNCKFIIILLGNLPLSPSSFTAIIRLKFHVKRHQNQALLCVAFLLLMECFWGSCILNSSFFFYRRVVLCRTSIPRLVRPSADAHVGFQFGVLKNKTAIIILCTSLFWRPMFWFLVGKNS